MFVGSDKATPSGSSLKNNNSNAVSTEIVPENQWLDDIPLDVVGEDENEVTVESYKEARPSRISTVSRTFNPQPLSSMPSRRMVVKRNISNERKDSQERLFVKNTRHQSSTVPLPTKTVNQPRQSRLRRDASMVFVDRKPSTSVPIMIADRQRKPSSLHLNQGRKSSSSTSTSKKSLVTLRIEEQPVAQRSIKQRRPSRKSMPVAIEDIQFLPQPPPQRRRSTGTSLASRNRAKRVSLVESKKKNYFIDHDDEDVSLENVMARLDQRDRNIKSRRSRSEERHLDGRRRPRGGFMPQGSLLTSGSTDDSGVYEEVRYSKLSN